jgi:hypothetical protein
MPPARYCWMETPLTGSRGPWTIGTGAVKTTFGENQEDKVAKPVTTSGNVAEFCTQNFWTL